LHDSLTYEIKFEDNVLILVGENGSGKTTILRLLFYFLSGRWSSLAQYKFEKLITVVNGIKFELSLSELSSSIKDVDMRLMRELPISIRRQISLLMSESRGNITQELETLFNKYDIPRSYMLHIFNLYESTEKGERKISKLQELIDFKLLYLPTYRRIEQDLDKIFKTTDIEEWKKSSVLRLSDYSKTHTELVEFGMKDVQQSIKETRDDLKDFVNAGLYTLTSGYLGDVVDKKYDTVDISEIKATSDQIVENVLDRIPENILTPEQKIHLVLRIRNVKAGGNLDDQAKVLCHYFLKLLKFQKELREKEYQITEFCNICNQYLVNKKLIYNSEDFSFNIIIDDSIQNSHNIELQHLSSGEKQIVALFNLLYLSKGNGFFIIIDEPELSLSVPWQRKFLVDVKNGGHCSGLLAATHSPFIYDNELQKYAHGIGEFASKIQLP
jgi:ABC-type transport system involved in cytochrome c biogenesis ATPase subunit